MEAVQYSRSGCPDTDVRTSGFEGWQDRARPSGSSRTRAAASTAFEAALEGHGRSQQIGSGAEYDLLLQRPQNIDRIARTLINAPVRRTFLRSALLWVLDSQGMVTDRHSKNHHPRIDRLEVSRFAGLSPPH
jgi:hypothetical protein